MKNKLLPFTFLLLFFFTIGNTNAQTQIGNDIDGLASGDFSGSSISMPDAYTVGIGAAEDVSDSTYAGYVRIYHWNGISWQQRGLTIIGETVDDQSGESISMPDSNTVAIGAKFNDGNGTDAGHVRVYNWNGSGWQQKGMDIDGESAYDYSGWSVSMPDANTVAIGAPINSGNSTNAGHVRVYSWNGNGWQQKGMDIDGEAAGDYSGRSVSMPDANTVAIGAWSNNGNGTGAGHVRVYSWNGIGWQQKGMDIDGEAAGNYSGGSVSMPDTNTVAIGAARNDGNGTDAGHVRVYSWNGIGWQQKGMDIDGEYAGDNSGWSVNMPNANIVAIGGIYNYGNGTNAGHVRIFQWQSNGWQLKGLDIDGENSGDFSGISVSMPDANTVAIGAPRNGGNGIDAGHVRVYDLTAVTGIEKNAFSEEYKIYPNPFADQITIESVGVHLNTQVEVINIKGQVVYETTTLLNGKTVLNTADWSKGIYIIRLTNEQGVGTYKLVHQ